MHKLLKNMILAGNTVEAKVMAEEILPKRPEFMIEAARCLEQAVKQDGPLKDQLHHSTMEVQIQRARYRNNFGVSAPPVVRD